MSRFTTNRVLAASAGVLGALALIGGDTPAPGGSGAMQALDLAAALRADPSAVVVLDVRDRAAFDEFHVPRASHVEGDRTDLLPVVAEIERSGDLMIVVAGGPGSDARPGWLSLRRAGHDRVYYVPDILTAWLDDIISPTLSPDAGPAERAAWEEQAELSRYFGGFPRIRETADVDTVGSTARLTRAKRRGCAF
jgi:hypothetical protein